MKVRTYKSFKEVNKRLDDIALLQADEIVLLSAIVIELSQDAEVKALAAKLKDRSTNLQAAFPATAGTTPP